MNNKATMAIYWAASCGGCEVALLNLHQHLLDLVDRWNLVFCPCLIDVKTAAICDLPDNSIDVTLFNGAIRNSENVEMARLLRRVSRTLVAFGSCAHEGCVPGLSNLHDRAGHFADIYLDPRFNDNPKGIIPKSSHATQWGDLHLPEFHCEVTTLADHVPVDLVLPGCPPESQRILELLAILEEKPLVVGTAKVVGGSSTVCLECPRSRDGRKVAQLHRIHQIVPEETHCLLEQGIVCRGVATREGCGALCPLVNMPCSGCYGAPEGMADQGAAMIGALAGIISTLDDTAVDNELVPQIEALLDGVPDFAGQFYTYSLAASLLKGRK